MITSVVGFDRGIGEGNSLAVWLIGMVGVNGFVIVKTTISIISAREAYIGLRKLDSHKLALFLVSSGLLLFVLFGEPAIRNIIILNGLPRT